MCTQRRNARPQFPSWRRARTWSAAVLLMASPLVFATTDAGSLAAPAAPAGSLGGKQVVAQVCAKCHEAGLNGAPKIGDQKNWSKRAAQGLTSLTRHALEGIRRMPAHGGNPNLTDAEISRAITYMVNQSGGHWIEPVSDSAASTERSGEQVVKAQCVKCHQAGLNGAPKIGDRAAWSPRMTRGVDHLVRSAVHGHGGMPPRGGEADLTDPELKAAILYMFNPQSAGRAKPEGAARKMASTLNEKGSNHATAGSVEIYFGLVAADSLLAYPSGSPERSMHGGVPKGPDFYHLNVSLQDRTSKAPITGAHVAVQIEPSGSGGTDRVSKDLEPIPFGAASYGNYVQLKRNTPYVITVQVRSATIVQPVEARFEQTMY